MDRRRFIRLCAGSTAMVAGVIRVARGANFVDFPKIRLTDAQGTPLKASTLSGEEPYVFYYPYRSLPCFLIRLGHSASAPQELTAYGDSYTWPGAVGGKKNIVSYVAACSHQLAYPDKASTVIYYSAGPTELVGKSGMIVCCAHASVFDPAMGGRRLHGEATEPLTAIRLEHDPADDGLYANGLAGTQLVERFFKIHRRRLIEEYGAGAYREPVEHAAAVIPLSKHTATLSNC